MPVNGVRHRGRSASAQPGHRRFASLAGTDVPEHYYAMPWQKAARVLAALKRDGWVETRRSGSHRVLVKGDQQRVWAYHNGVDLGGPAMSRIARDYGYTIDELRKL
jgi:predicted RNA binding protein YcfA (HicA-like mRNA interferase family)